ncbi:mechanosensitive ion channel [Synoicihabitans lomoniglobus]|uniref:Mechanosensitive ion channel n=2 Tax=Synoicihabitans lomoniglobus TaxID=2909285 RepID=A0AAF0I824_9BACT|nr:mechanosensitive ion channel [Opitutaceae bacterium LMO-M01]
MTEALSSLIPMAITAAVCGIALRLAHWLLLGREQNLGGERALPRQLIMLGLTLASVALLVLSLPVSDSSRNQVLGLVGLLVSGLFAFSSTTLVANLTAGIMLRVTKPFRTGDFIKIDEYFGRVSERGLLDTEVQTEFRDLIAFPHTYLISHPVTTIRASGTIVTTVVSLGYDVHHATVEEHLKAAATATGLEDPFVHITELGNYAVSYRVAGLLTEVKSLLTSRSNLNRHVLDQLHRAGIEIASPTIMNQRRLPDAGQIMPQASDQTATQPIASPESTAETLAFDKADQAEALELRRIAIEEQIKALESQLSGADATRRHEFTTKINALKAERESIVHDTKNLDADT